MALDFGALVRNASGIAGGLHTGRQQAEDRERQTEMSALEQLLMNAQIKRQEAMTGEDKSRGRYYDAQAGRYQAEAEKEARELKEEADYWRSQIPELTGTTDQIAVSRGREMAKHAQEMEKIDYRQDVRPTTGTNTDTATLQRIRSEYNRQLNEAERNKPEDPIMATREPMTASDSTAALDYTLNMFPDAPDRVKEMFRQSVTSPTEPEVDPEEAALDAQIAELQRMIGKLSGGGGAGSP